MRSKHRKMFLFVTHIIFIVISFVMFYRIATILSHSEILASTLRFIYIKQWEGGQTCICSYLYVPGCISYTYLKTSLSQQLISEWDLMKPYSFTNNEICNLIKIFKKYKWTEFIHPEQEEDYGSTWHVACGGSRKLIVTLCAYKQNRNIILSLLGRIEIQQQKKVIYSHFSCKS